MAFTNKKHDRAKSRAATPEGARRDTAPTPKIRDGRCDTFPANMVATLPRGFGMKVARSTRACRFACRPC
ncbi:hypothetical protein [Burkholderia lata]|uniref:hypothetical protein n=1 Tax=Burkholderia lata (strain ATCC 17760 / DSM 23089 / LMG 22485 / NCIMB 9086 / R18194 / 383) TaxID=482957 RepID=UPI001582841E|nr:hypothetical protein [Burkholderia lata]